jgi:hypothetical protein
MKIHAIKHDSANATQLDLDQFSKELRALSDRYNLKLISLGAMATMDSGSKGTTYLAIWSTEPNENQGN